MSVRTNNISKGPCACPCSLSSYLISVVERPKEDTCRPQKERITQKHMLSVPLHPDAFKKHLCATDTKKEKQLMAALSSRGSVSCFFFEYFQSQGRSCRSFTVLSSYFANHQTPFPGG